VKRAVLFLVAWAMLWIRKHLPASQYGDSNGYNSHPLPSTHLRFILYNILTDLIAAVITSRVDSASWLIKQIWESRALNCD